MYNRRGNTPLITVVVIFVIVAVVGVLYFTTNTSQPAADLPTPHSAMNDEKMMEGDKAMMDDEGDDTTMMEPGSKYVQYEKEGYEAIKSQKHVLYFFANWCPTCIPADAEFQARMSEIPDDITLVRVNYNDTQTDADEEALADKLGITYQHTFVLLENGEVVSRWNGGAVDELVSRVN